MGHPFDSSPFRDACGGAVVFGGEHGRSPFVVGCASALKVCGYRLALTRRGSPLPSSSAASGFALSLAGSPPS